jgi:hypothetical protein
MIRDNGHGTAPQSSRSTPGAVTALIGAEALRADAPSEGACDPLDHHRWEFCGGTEAIGARAQRV